VARRCHAGRQRGCAAQVSSDRAYLAKQLAKERHTRYDDAGDLGGESQMAPYPFF